MRHPEIEIIRAKAGSSRIVFVSGNFNIVHPGHLRLLRFARDCGDFLVVGVLGDGIAEGAILGEAHRLDGVSAIVYVDHAFLLRCAPEEFVACLRPEVVVKGKEHEDLVNAEAEAVARYGGKLVFSSGDVSFSSVELFRQELETCGVPLRVPAGFPGRHGFDLAGLEGVVHRMRGLRVVVLGEIIVDEYIACEPLGMSREDPTIVVSPVASRRFLGGAGIVAGHAVGLGAEVSLISVVGDDEAAAYATERVVSYGVKPYLVTDSTRPTIQKQRYRAGSKTLLRVNHVKAHAVSRDIGRRVVAALEECLAGADLVIFSDFNYGFLHDGLVPELIRLGKESGVVMVADSQCSSQTGDLGRFKGMALLTPTEHEARIALRDNRSGLVVLTERLRQEAACENIILTLGEEGVLIHGPIRDGAEWHTDRLPALNPYPKDVAGAGDSLLTVSALCLTCGATVWEAALLGSVAAGCQVMRVGNVPLSAQEILSALRNSQGA